MISHVSRSETRGWALIAVIALMGCSMAEEDPVGGVRPIDYEAIEARLEAREPRGKVSDAFPNISVTDQHGRTYRFFDDLVKDRSIAVNFMFTECALVCPGTTSNLARLHTAFEGAVGRDITFLSISLDPETDTEEALHGYWEAFGSHEGWLYLRGDFEETELLRRRMGVYDLDPVIDADKTEHAGIVTFGNDATDRWAALPALSSIHDLKGTIIRFALAGRRQSPKAPRPAHAEANELAERVYPGRGVIRSIDLERSEVSLEHEAIPGLMPGMTMTFAVSRKIDLDRFVVESDVSFGLVNEPTGFRVVEMVTRDGGSTPQPEPVVSSLSASGRQDYALYCASCHGEKGNGDGPLAGSLDPKPARHSDGEYMNRLSDEYMFRVIQQGGTAVGKSAMMAGWGGTLSENQIHGLVAFIRSLAEPPYSLQPSRQP